MSTNKTMKNKLVNTMRATKAGTNSADTDAAATDAPVENKAAAPVKKRKKAAASKPAASGFTSTCRVWPD